MQMRSAPQPPIPSALHPSLRRAGEGNLGELGHMHMRSAPQPPNPPPPPSSLLASGRAREHVGELGPHAQMRSRPPNPQSPPPFIPPCVGRAREPGELGHMQMRSAPPTPNPLRPFIPPCVGRARELRGVGTHADAFGPPTPNPLRPSSLLASGGRGNLGSWDTCRCVRPPNPQSWGGRLCFVADGSLRRFACCSSECNSADCGASEQIGLPQDWGLGGRTRYKGRGKQEQRQGHAWRASIRPCPWE